MYLKLASPKEPSAVANEYIGAELAKHIRLPIPPHFCGYIRRTSRKAFCSLDATVGGAKLPAINPVLACTEEPDLCTGVLIFDIWIANVDRHLRNISYQRERMPHKLTIIDHSRALFYYQNFNSRFKGDLGIIRPEDKNPHALLYSLSSPDYFHKWITRVKNVSSEYIKEIVNDAAELGLPATARVYGYDFLLRRRDSIETLIRSNQAAFRGIRDWGLLW
ncbi:MAG TPA: HipA family kinase [Longimicrobium sp.]|uniref:HipA family kinase n=1 Tax=Longimicrobium sp. TaxID=2029185 RepID=UPI002EDABF34